MSAVTATPQGGEPSGNPGNPPAARWPKARILTWTTTAVTLVFLAFFAVSTDWSGTGEALKRASIPLLALAAAINFLSLLTKGVRWWVFLKPAGAPSLPMALRATVAGAGLNNVLPAQGGDAARCILVTRASGVASSRVLASMVLDRIFDPLGFIILFVYGASAFNLPEALVGWRTPAQVALGAAFIAMLWLLRWAKGPRRQPAASRPEAVASWRGALRMYAREFAMSARELSTGWRFVAALLLSVAAWACQVLTFQYAGAAAGADMTLAASVVTMLAVNLGLLVRVTPGNVGIFQVVFVLAAVPFGIPKGEAIAISILIQAIQIVPVTIIGALLSAGSGLKAIETEEEGLATVAK